MREGRYIYFHRDGNPGVEFDSFSHGSSSEAGDSEDDDSEEVSTCLQATEPNFLAEVARMGEHARVSACAHDAHPSTPALAGHT